MFARQRSPRQANLTSAAPAYAATLCTASHDRSQGTLTYASGNHYEGSWKADTKNGAGTFLWYVRAPDYLHAILMLSRFPFQSEATAASLHDLFCCVGVIGASSTSASGRMACLMCAQCDLEVVEFSLTLCLFAAEAYLNGFRLASPGIWRASLATNTEGELPLISLPSARTCFSGTCVQPLGRLRGFLRARRRRVARTSCENATWASGPRANGRAVEPSTLPPVRAVALFSRRMTLT